MNPAAWESLVGQAVRQGLLPEGANADSRAGRPWPVVLMSFLGALMAALPLTGFVFSLFGEALLRGGMALSLGALGLAGGALLLRRARALFVEHLALVLLLLGLGLMAWGMVELLPQRAGLLAACALALVVAATLPAAWVRLLLGACAALLAWPALHPSSTGVWQASAPAGAGLVLAWAAALGAQQRLLFGPDAPQPARQQRRLQFAARLDALLAGWLLASVAAIALTSGAAMLVTASLPPGAPLSRPGGRGWLEPLVALALLLGTLAALAPRWPLLRTPLAAALALLAAGLAVFMPGLALTGAAGLLAARTRRPALAACAALAAAWIVGSFYYSLQWPLAIKALVLAGAGAALGTLLGLLRRRAPRANGASTPPRPGRRTAWVGLALVATLAVVNVGIRQKEALIAHGRPVYVELAPVDPRSLMQGDYMALNYRMTPALEQALRALPPTARPLAQARIDARGIARLEGLAQDAGPLAPDELRIALKPKHGRWVVASDAWFFAEGEALRFEPARYGEFRIGPDGEALLVGLADADLRRLGEPPR